MKVIIAAAQTGGHINPGIAIANKIKEKNRNARIMFIGTTRGLENDLVPRAGYELKTIDAYGINRKISISNIKNMFKTLKGFGEAKKIVKDLLYIFNKALKRVDLPTLGRPTIPHFISWVQSLQIKV